jgi:predicted RNA binding protein YcfA (HicA-like mRNA interferase family)
MPRLTPVQWKKLECVFLALGFKLSRHTGSHRVYTKPGVKRPVIIPTYDSVEPDIILSNLRTAGISRKDYFKYLRDC